MYANPAHGPEYGRLQCALKGATAILTNIASRHRQSGLVLPPKSEGLRQPIGNVHKRKRPTRSAIGDAYMSAYSRCTRSFRSMIGLIEDRLPCKHGMNVCAACVPEQYVAADPARPDGRSVSTAFPSIGASLRGHKGVWLLLPKVHGSFLPAFQRSL